MDHKYSCLVASYPKFTNLHLAHTDIILRTHTTLTHMCTYLYFKAGKEIL